MTICKLWQTAFFGSRLLCEWLGANHIRLWSSEKINMQNIPSMEMDTCTVYMYRYCTTWHRNKIYYNNNIAFRSLVRTRAGPVAIVQSRHDKSSKGRPGAGCGIRVVVAPSAILLSAARFDSRNLRRTESERIILYIIYAHSWHQSLLATDRRPPALAFACTNHYHYHRCCILLCPV